MIAVVRTIIIYTIVALIPPFCCRGITLINRTASSLSDRFRLVSHAIYGKPGRGAVGSRFPIQVSFSPFSPRSNHNSYEGSGGNRDRVS